MNISGRQVYFAYAACVTTVFVGLGFAGLARDSAPETVGTGVVQMGTPIVGTNPITAFNDGAGLDPSQVSR